MFKQACELETPPANAASITQIELAAKIAELHSDKSARSFFTSGGSESVETAVKMAKKYQIKSNNMNKKSKTSTKQNRKTKYSLRTR